MASIRVKVDRLTLIAALEQRVANNEKAKASNAKKQAKVKAARAAHAKAVLKSLKPADVEEASIHYVGYGATRNQELRVSLNTELDIPEFVLPDDIDCERVLDQWDLERIESGLKLLRMSTEASLSMSAIGDLARFL